jgi:hypothetical protein
MRSWRNQVDAPARGAGGPRGLSRFKSGRAHHAPGGRLHADVAQRLAHHLAKVRVASSNLVICSHAVVPQQVTAVPMPWPPPESGQPLACRPSPMARGTAFRARVFGVRIPGTVLMESEPIRDRDRFEGGSASWRWGSCPPLSARGRCAAGAAAGLEPSRRVTPWGSTPPSSSPGTSAFFGNASRTRLQMAG